MPQPETPDSFPICVNGQTLTAWRGQTIAAALVANGQTVLRRTRSGRPRGVFCGMGVCFDCLVTVDGLADQRACVTLARPGMQIRLTDNGQANCGGD